MRRAAHPGRIVVGIDARDGKVAVEGWTEGSEIRAVDLARRFEDAGVAAIVYTDIARDGMLTGPNLEATALLASALRIPVIVSGGVATNEDVLQSARLREKTSAARSSDARSTPAASTSSRRCASSRGSVRPCCSSSASSRVSTSTRGAS